MLANNNKTSEDATRLEGQTGAAKEALRDVLDSLACSVVRFSNKAKDAEDKEQVVFVAHRPIRLLSCSVAFDTQAAKGLVLSVIRKDNDGGEVVSPYELPQAQEPFTALGLPITALTMGSEQVLSLKSDAKALPRGAFKVAWKLA